MKTAIAFLLLVSPLIAAEQDKTTAAPEGLSSLKPFLGEWTVKGEFSHDAEPLPFAATAKGAFALNSKFVRFEIDIKDLPGLGHVAMEALMNYDEKRQAYRGVFFISEEATPLIGVGTFDGKAVTFKGTPEGAQEVIELKFDISKADTIELTVSGQDDATGQTKQMLSATFTKKK
jgi:hypothetical protein